MKTRRSGILLHVTSLPSDFGIGDMGDGAYRFADFLADSGQTVWQVLPFNPSSPAYGNSPYCSYSAFAGNPLLISPGRLIEDGYLTAADIGTVPPFPPDRVDYDGVAAFKYGLLMRAYERFRLMPDIESRYAAFLHANSYWLEDYALFMCLKEHFGGAAWNAWPREFRDRTEPMLGQWRQKLAYAVDREKFYQFVFYRQWSALKDYCNGKKIGILGDMPIYVSYDSADVWSNPRNFKLDDEGTPLFVAGVPPDYFSQTGQLWGNPVYAWDRMEQDGFIWWCSRMEHNLHYFDMVRLDHFRGFVAYWEVPASEKTAVNGKWVEAPAGQLFDALFRRFTQLPIVAEDLGVITPDVREIMKRYGFPGMKILLFAFNGDCAENPYIPHNHLENCIVYTGTHDNNTAKGWFQHDATPLEKENLLAYFGRDIDESNVSAELVRFAMMSVAGTAIIPLQDFLGLGSEARMNMPSVAFGNWAWRVASEQLPPELGARIGGVTRLYGRG